MRALTLFILLLMPGLSWSQFIFQNLRGQDGLSAKEVRCLYKDKQGFLWIGTTHGLNRFDGAVVRQYKKLEGQKDIYVNAIYPLDKNENLLIGTSRGILVFDKHISSFTEDPRFAALKDDAIAAIKPDGQDRLWIVASSKVYIYEKGKLLPMEVVIPATKVIRDQEFSFSAFTWDTKRYGFWVGGGSNTYFIDCLKGQVLHKNNNPQHIKLLDAKDVYTIAIDGDDNLWYGCNADWTLNFWDSHSNKVVTYNELDGKQIFKGCNHLFVDHQNRLWISTKFFSAFMKEPGRPIKTIPYSQTQGYSIGYGYFRDAIEDDEGNVWLGTINGVSKSQDKAPVQAIYQLPSFEFFLNTGFAHANDVKIEGDTIVACKEEGIVFYNMSERTYKRYVVTEKKDANMIRNRFVMSAKSGSTWWFAGEDGIFSLSKEGKALERFKKIKKGLPFAYSHFIFADQKGRIWFEVWNDAIYRYDPVTEKCDRFDGSDEKYGKFKFNNCQSFLELHSGNILFAMNGTGILKFNLQKEKFSVAAVNNAKQYYATKMIEDSQGGVWASVTGRGILKFDRRGVLADSINTSSGLLSDNIQTINIDRRGYIWAANREGLMFFNPDTKAVTRVEVDLGQTLQDYWNNLTMANGKVYAIMLDHIVVIDPYRFAAIAVKQPPHLTSVKTFGEEITDFRNEKTLDLSADEDFITFQYASLNHRDIPSLQYSYKLSGIDKDWVNAGRSLVVSYNNIPSGLHTFKVRSTDENGKWMNASSTLKIYVNPHWWGTWWFIILEVAAAIGLLWIAYQNVIRRRQKKVIERTIDYFANSVYGENSVNEICWDIARNCISQLNFEDCVVYLLDKESNVLVQKAAYGPKNPTGHEISNPIEIQMGAGIVGTVAATGKALLIPDTTKDSRYIVDDEKRFSELAIPILHEGKVIGVVDSEHRDKNFFTAEHLKALSTIASISANKIAEALAEGQAQEKEIKLLEINKMLAESQLMALRAQMNPHFVFNCLNSIQECIVTEKYGEASKYLNKFSKLFRMVLNNSGKNLVTIEEEKEVLELYLELEQMRFEQSFSYEITIDEELEEEEIFIPSMLLQPYVENGLWHGLMHTTGERRLTITFKKINEEYFECRIDDNGIGRKKSFELKAQRSKAKRHESKGLQISEDRLAVLQRQGQHATVNIIDKYDEDGQATGTLIIIELSTFLKKT